MPWCPKCRTEYRPGFTKCADCGEDLVEELAPLPPAPGERPGALPDRPGCRPLCAPALLTNLPDYQQAGMLAALLEENGMPSYLQEAPGYGRAAALYTGFSMGGWDVYVEAGQREAAREFLLAFLTPPPGEENLQAEPLPWEEEAEDEADPPQDPGFIYKLFLLLAAALALLVLWWLLR